MTCISYLGVEEVGVTLEFLRQSLVRLCQKFGFVANSLQESIINLILNVVVVISGLLSLIVLKECLDLLFKLIFFLVKIHHYVIVVLFLFVIDRLQILELLSEPSQFLDLWSQFGFLVLDLSLNLGNYLSHFLESAVFLVVEGFIHF
jgi:hypothetical protein